MSEGKLLMSISSSCATILRKDCLPWMEIPRKQTPFDRVKLTPLLRGKLTPPDRGKLTPSFDGR